LKRRELLFAASAAASLPLVQAARAQTTVRGGSRDFVLVPGSWHGAWCWSRVAAELQSKGHQAYPITQTGLGDRKHLAACATDINVFVDDIVNTIESEELHDVVLVGHSFAGIPITGVAARISERIAVLVYLDAGVPRPGDSALSSLSPAEQDARRKAAVSVDGVQYLLAPPSLPAFWGLAGSDVDWVRRRLTPHPFATYATGLQFDDAAWNRVPRIYVECTAPRHPALNETKARLRAEPGWTWKEIASGHDAMVAHPKELASLLIAS
jgi:pimeloyl-ACP methyl ester carboxylesterase